MSRKKLKRAWLKMNQAHPYLKQMKKLIFLMKMKSRFTSGRKYRDFVRVSPKSISNRRYVVPSAGFEAPFLKRKVRILLESFLNVFGKYRNL